MGTLLCALACALSAPGQTDVRHHDLRALLALAREAYESFDHRTPLEDPSLASLELDGPLWPGVDRHGGDLGRLVQRGVLEVAAAIARDVPLDGSVQGYGLAVSGDARTQRAVASALRVLERWLARTWCVELVELPPEALAGLTAAVLDPHEAEALLARHPSAPRQQRLATVRRAARFTHERNAALLHDYDVEVSMTMGVADPQVYVVRWGSDAYVTVSPNVDGRLLVRAVWRAGDPLGPLRTPSAFGVPSDAVEMASGTGARCVGSALLERGGALVLAQREGIPDEHGPLVVRVSRVAGDGPDADDVAALGLGLLVRPPWGFPPHHVGGPSPSGGDYDRFAGAFFGAEEDTFWGPSTGASGDPALAGDLVDELEGLWEDAGLPGRIVRLGQEALAVGAPDALALARRHLLARAAPYARSVEYEVRHGEVEPGVAADLVVGQPVAAGHPALGALDGRLHLPGASGDAVQGTAVREWMFVQDHDMEIGAPGALCVADPIVSTVAAGVSVVCRADLDGDGGAVLSLYLRAGAADPPPFRTRPATTIRLDPDGPSPYSEADVELPTASTDDVAAVVPVRLGAWTLVALDAPAPRADATGPARTRLVVARVTLVPESR